MRTQCFKLTTYSANLIRQNMKMRANIPKIKMKTTNNLTSPENNNLNPSWVTGFTDAEYILPTNLWIKHIKEMLFASFSQCANFSSNISSTIANSNYRTTLCRGIVI